MRTGKQIQSAILNYIRQHEYTELGLLKGSCLAYKVEIANERGVPDLLCCINGRFCGIEIKGSSDTTKPIQAAQMKRIHIAGGSAFVVESLEDFKHAIKDRT